MSRTQAATRLALILTLAASAAAAETFPGSASLDAAVEQAVREDQIPGAVLLVWHNGEVLHHKAYGARALVPRREPMTLDTIFDAASLTKVVATTSAIMKLFEEGKVRLNDRITEYLPEFQGGKSDITVRQLLTHFSGLHPDLDLDPPWSGYEAGIRQALAGMPVAPPGARFQYSDINFILLGEIVRRQSGQTLSDYSREKIFQPLGMRDTMFQPPASLRPRIAPTEIVAGSPEPLRGVVHDDTARFMGGVAGHAGMFTTAGDLLRFAELMLGLGQRGGVRLFSPLTVRKFTSPQSPADQPILRGLGWDIDSPYSGNRGELFPVGSYGHTGFTGTSLWIDPSTQTSVILLAASVHPKRRPPITSLRGRVGTITAAALGIDVPGVSLTGYNETLTGAGIRRVVARDGQVRTGLDVLAEQNFASLRGQRVGLITNHTGVSRDGRRNVDLMRAAGVEVVALFSPEHGITGREDRENIGHGKDASTGIPVYSLYSSQQRRPTDEMLRGVDTLVFDIQDIGVRYYTYTCTMAYAMEEAAKRGLLFVVLDRPNPITGTKVEGPLLDAGLQSFIGCFPIPPRHGMTVGELARMFAGERGLNLKLKVVEMKGWQRGDWFDSTGLMWVDPSPNMRSLTAALLYPGIALLEASKNYSVGRGTDAPFEQIGADWIKGAELAEYLNRRMIPGVRTYGVRFRPTASRLAGKDIEGVRFFITDRQALNAVRLGLEVAGALATMYPGKIDFDASEKLIGNRKVIAKLRTGVDPRSILAGLEDEVRDFAANREKYLLYK